MGRALAVSKLESIKEAVGSLSKNIKQEANTIDSSMDSMLKKHTPMEIDIEQVNLLGKKATMVMAQMPKINELEQSLEIQDKD